GYDCEYDTGLGALKQRNIVANHVAILHPGEDARCGEACSIGDAFAADWSANVDYDPQENIDFPEDENIDWRPSMRRRNCDQEGLPMERYQQASEMGKRPGSPVGARVVATVGYAAASCSIGPAPDGGAEVWSPAQQDDGDPHLAPEAS